MPLAMSQGYRQYRSLFCIGVQATEKDPQGQEAEKSDGKGIALEKDRPRLLVHARIWCLSLTLLHL